MWVRLIKNAKLAVDKEVSELFMFSLYVICRRMDESIEPSACVRSSNPVWSRVTNATG